MNGGRNIHEGCHGMQASESKRVAPLVRTHAKDTEVDLDASSKTCEHRTEHCKFAESKEHGRQTQKSNNVPRGQTTFENCEDCVAGAVQRQGRQTSTRARHPNMHGSAGYTL